MIIVLVEAIAADEGEASRLLAAARDVVAITREEDGCVGYDFSRDLLNPAIVRVAERWRDQEALQAHLRAPHTTAFFQAMKEINLQSLTGQAYDATGARDLF